MQHGLPAAGQPPTPQQTSGALHCVFFGGLLCLLDITHSSISVFRGQTNGWRFDFLSDTLGVILILYAISTLHRVRLRTNYQGYLQFVSIVAFLSLIDTIHTHWIYERHELVRAMTTILSLARLAAVMAFCTAMVTLARFVGGDAAARSFRITRRLFAVLYVAPLAVLYMVGLAAIAGAKVSFHWTGWWVNGILVVFALPLFHFFVSTRRLKFSMERAVVRRFG